MSYEMSYMECADFFLTGLVVAWPAMLWSGNVEPGVAVCILLLFGLFCCGMMAEDEDRTVS